MPRVLVVIIKLFRQDANFRVSLRLTDFESVCDYLVGDYVKYRRGDLNPQSWCFGYNDSTLIK